jgi:hypothetical protein
MDGALLGGGNGSGLCPAGGGGSSLPWMEWRLAVLCCLGESRFRLAAWGPFLGRAAWGPFLGPAAWGPFLGPAAWGRLSLHIDAETTMYHCVNLDLCCKVDSCCFEDSAVMACHAVLQQSEDFDLVQSDCSLPVVGLVFTAFDVD